MQPRTDRTLRTYHPRSAPGLFRLLAVAVFPVIIIALWAILTRSLAGDLVYADAVLMQKTSQGMGQGKKHPGSPSASQSAAPLQRANALVELAVRMNPVSGAALLTLAKNRALVGNLAGAKDAASRADRLLVSAETLDQLGWIHLELANRDAAQRYFRAALAIDPADREALQRMVWIAKLNLNQPGLTDRDSLLNAMLGVLRNLQSYTCFDTNAAYLWSQYWHERARVSHSPVHYAAGLRAAAQAENWRTPPNYTTLYKPNEMFAIMNYFMMGARGLPVDESGRPFPAKRPVNPSKIQLSD